MTRKSTLFLLVLFLALPAVAKERSVSAPAQNDARLALGSGASVTGEVSSVSGTQIMLAGGAVSLDASTAKIVRAEGGGSIASIRPGMLIVATVREPSTISTGPLVATTIAILRTADVTLTGTVQHIDTAGSQFLLLNKSVRVNASTTFVNATGLASIQPNMMVVVEANATGSALTASRVTLLAPIPPRTQTASGIVKSIGSTQWVITVRERDTTFVVNGNTKFLGDPKVGDRVEVLYTVDSAHANVALAIAKHVVLETPKVTRFSGVIKSVENHYFVITRDDDKKDVIVRWPENVRILWILRAGDRVEVVATENADGTYNLVTIVPK